MCGGGGFQRVIKAISLDSVFSAERRRKKANVKGGGTEKQQGENEAKLVQRRGNTIHTQLLSFTLFFYSSFVLSLRRGICGKRVN